MSYKLRVQCFKATPYALGDHLFLNVEQIIPMKEAEEYTISMAEKNQDDITNQEELKTRHIIRKEYWTKLLNQMNKQSSLFQNVSPSKEGWILAGSGISGISYEFVVTGSYARAGLYIGRAKKDENKWVFNQLLAQREEIEKGLEHPLVWEELPNKNASRLNIQLNNVSIFNKDDWGIMSQFSIDNMVKLEKVLKEPLKKIGQQLKSKDIEY